MNPLFYVTFTNVRGTSRLQQRLFCEFVHFFSPFSSASNVNGPICFKFSLKPKLYRLFGAISRGFKSPIVPKYSHDPYIDMAFFSVENEHFSFEKLCLLLYRQFSFNGFLNLAPIL